MAPAPSFTCPRCATVNRHPDDVANGYCGRCHWYTGDPQLAGFFILSPPDEPNRCPQCRMLSAHLPWCTRPVPMPWEAPRTT